MTPEERQKLRNLIIKHEGFRDKVYKDTTGHLTIGYGHNLESKGITQFAANVILDDDIMWFLPRLSKSVPFFDGLDFARKSVLLDMAFNLGLHGLLEFTEMLEAVRVGNYATAAACILESKWAAQVGNRAKEDAYIMKTGDI